METQADKETGDGLLREQTPSTTMTLLSLVKAHLVFLHKQNLRPYAILLGQVQVKQLLEELDMLGFQRPGGNENIDHLWQVPLKRMGQPNLLAITYKL